MCSNRVVRGQRSVSTAPQVSSEGERASWIPSCCWLTPPGSGTSVSLGSAVERESGMPFVPVATSVYQSVGQGFRLELGHRGKRTAHVCGKDYRLRAECQSLQPDSYSLVGAPGREASILTEQARASRDHAPRFLGSGNTGKARQHREYPAPGRPLARVSGRRRPH